VTQVTPVVSSPVGLSRRWRIPASNRTALAATAVLGSLCAMAALAPWISPDDPRRLYGVSFTRPNGAHPLGLDYAGHDVLSVLVWGARASLKIGFAASLISLCAGGVIGVIGGYFGGLVDKVTTFLTDFFLVIPVLPLMITIAALYGTTQADLVAIIGLLSWMGTARVVRSQVKSIRERPYIRRTRALGASHVRTIVFHIFPQVAPLLAASTSLAIAVAIFFEAALAFLGLGDLSQPSWGNMIALNFQNGAIIVRAWWAIVPPGLAIASVVLCSNLIARGFEQSLNPRLLISHIGREPFRLRPSAEQLIKLTRTMTGSTSTHPAPSNEAEA
jgi:peptide/nickel transport system permease protein